MKKIATAKLIVLDLIDSTTVLKIPELVIVRLRKMNRMKMCSETIILLDRISTV
jgi:hypothetical protein